MMRISFSSFFVSHERNTISTIFTIRSTFPFSFLSPRRKLSTQSQQTRILLKAQEFPKTEKKESFLRMIKCDDMASGLLEMFKISLNSRSLFLSYDTRWPKRKRKNRKKLKKNPKINIFFPPFFHFSLAARALASFANVVVECGEIKNLECKFFYGFYNKLRLLPLLSHSLALASSSSGLDSYLLFFVRARFYFPSGQHTREREKEKKIMLFFVPDSSSLLLARNVVSRQCCGTEKKTSSKPCDDRVNRFATLDVTGMKLLSCPPFDSARERERGRAQMMLSCRCRSSSQKNTAKMLENSKNISTLGGTRSESRAAT